MAIVSFFPPLVAGPIERAKGLLVQFQVAMMSEGPAMSRDNTDFATALGSSLDTGPSLTCVPRDTAATIPTTPSAAPSFAYPFCAVPTCHAGACNRYSSACRFKSVPCSAFARATSPCLWH